MLYRTWPCREDEIFGAVTPNSFITYQAPGLGHRGGRNRYQPGPQGDAEAGLRSVRTGCQTSGFVKAGLSGSWIVPGVVDGLIPRKDYDHAST